MSKSEKRAKGDDGENAAVNYLKKHGYKILERNHENKFGELDIVAKYGKQVVFVEVKSQEMGTVEGFHPERNVDERKQKKLIRAAEAYLIKNKYPANTQWQIDVIGVELDYFSRRASIRHTLNAVSREAY